MNKVILIFLLLTMQATCANAFSIEDYPITIINKSGYPIDFYVLGGSTNGPNPIPNGQVIEKISYNSGCGLTFGNLDKGVECFLNVDGKKIQYFTCNSNNRGEYLIPKILPDNQTIVFTYYIPPSNLLIK